MQTEFLKELGLSDEQIAAVIAENGKDVDGVRGRETETRAELERLRAELSERDTEIVTLRKGQTDADELRGRIAELEDADAKRRAVDEARRFDERFSAASGGAKFVNDFTRAGIMEKFRNAVGAAENAELSDAEVFAAVTDGCDNLFEPDGGVPSVVSGSGYGFGDAPSDRDIREIMGLAAE